MRRYRFPLETLRRVRTAQERAAIAGLASANLAWRKASEDLTVRQDAYLALTWPLGANSSEQLRRTRAGMHLSASCLHAAERQLATAGAGRDAAMARWSLAARNVAALERLDERLAEEHRSASEREAQREADDIVNTRWQAASVRPALAATGEKP